MPTTRRRLLKAQNSEVALHQLPDEVLADVFQLSVLSHDWDKMVAVKYLSTISGVCSRWRYVALGCPVLWTSISYNQQNTPIKRHAQSRIKAYIQRSKMASINISFHVARDDLDDSKDITFFKKVILPHISRCRVLNLVVNTDTQLRSVIPLDGSLGALLSFQCTVLYTAYSPNAPASSDMPVSLFCESNNARLRSLAVSSDAPVSLQHVDASRMLYISIRGPSAIWADTLELVSRSSSTLESLSINSFHPPPYTVYSSGRLLIADAPSRIPLPNLKRLSWSANSLWTRLARKMDMPNLTYICLHNVDILVESWYEAHGENGALVSPLSLRPLLGHVPRLQSLCISTSDTYDLEQLIVELFIDYPSIVLLEIDGWEDHSVEQMLQMLAAEPENWGKIANHQSFPELYAPRNVPYPSTPLLPALRIMRFITQSSRRLQMIALEGAIADALTHRPTLRIEHNETVLDGPEVEPKEMRTILDKLEEDENIMEPRWR